MRAAASFEVSNPWGLIVVYVLVLLVVTPRPMGSVLWPPGVRVILPRFAQLAMGLFQPDISYYQIFVDSYKDCGQGEGGWRSRLLLV